MALVAISLVLHFSSDTEARGRGSSSRSRQAAAARKQQMIKSIQQQVATAREILTAADSQRAMSQAQVDQAIDKLSGFRESIGSAQDDARQAAKTLHEIEAEILAANSSNSDLARAQRALDQAKVALHNAVHDAVTLPDDSHKTPDAGRLGDLAKLSEPERRQLEAHEGYQTARKNVDEAAREFARMRQSLLETDADWVSARAELREAQKSAQDANQQAGTVGVGSIGNRQDLRKAQNVVAATRVFIAEGEARLRQLGASSSAGARPSSSRK